MGTGEDAVYLLGGRYRLSAGVDEEDGGLKHLQREKEDGRERPGLLGGDAFVMGNSADGIRPATWLLEPQFEATRRLLLIRKLGVAPQRRGAVLGAFFISRTRILREAMCSRPIMAML